VINRRHQPPLTLVPLISPKAFRHQIGQFQRAQRDAGAAISDLVKRSKLKVKKIGTVPFVSRSEAMNYSPEAGGRPPKKK
jgi:hypothetical protein